MKINEKLAMPYDGLYTEGAITIVAFGDSVTHAMLAGPEIDYETVYWNLLRRRINQIRPEIPVNVICSGIGGATAKGSLARMEKQVFSHSPDLVIICFGLNDVGGCTLEEYVDSMSAIFARCRETGTDAIFLTPNMMNTSLAEDLPPQDVGFATFTMSLQVSGKLDEYIDAAKKRAEEMGITVCDCYAEWKKLSETEDITHRLCNRINHPSREMHVLFADMLYDTIFG